MNPTPAPTQKVIKDITVNYTDGTSAQAIVVPHFRLISDVPVTVDVVSTATENAIVANNG